MEIRAAVAEDSEECQQWLLECMQRYSSERDVTWQTRQYTDGAELTFSYEGNCDVLFLDIEMPVLNGLETARRIRKMDRNVIIVFVTNMANYAVQGYEVDALDFITKPFSYEAFRFRMDRIVKRVREEKSSAEIILHNVDGCCRIRICDLQYVEVNGHILTYHTDIGTFSQRGTMKQAEAQLSPYGFFRCSQSCLVSLRHIRSIVKDCVIVRETVLPLSRNFKQKLIRALTEFTVR